MDPELKGLLEKNIQLAQENNELLRAMKRQGQMRFWGSLAFYGVLIIGPLFFLQWFLSGPQVQNLMQQYQELLK